LVIVSLSQGRSHLSFERAIKMSQECHSIAAFLLCFPLHRPSLHFGESAPKMVARNLPSDCRGASSVSRRITHADGQRAALFVILSAATVIQARTLENDSVWEKVAALDDKELETEVSNFMVFCLARPLRIEARDSSS
jgi:hypothetical protein